MRRACRLTIDPLGTARTENSGDFLEVVVHDDVLPPTVVIEQPEYRVESAVAELEQERAARKQ